MRKIPYRKTLVCAVVAVGLGLAWLLRPQPQPNPLQVLYDIQAQGDTPLVGRPGLGLTYRGEDPTRSASLHSRNSLSQPGTDAVSAQILLQAEEMPQLESEELLATMSLLKRRLEDAIPTLEYITNHPDAPVSAFNTLTAAYLTRFRQQGTAYDLVRALSAGLQAQKLAPDSPESRFNLAWVLSMFPLPGQATLAWSHYLEVADDEVSAQEARDWIEQLSEPTDLELWQREEHQLANVRLPVDQQRIADLVRRFPYQSRLYVEHRLLGSWAEAVTTQRAETAAKHLAIARAIGQELAEQRGDYLVLDALATIDKHLPFPGGSRDDLLLAHRQWAEGMVRYHSGQWALAEPLLEEAQGLFQRLDCPMAGWAELYRIISVLQEGFDGAKPALEQLLASTDADRYPALVGRTHWIITFVIQNDETKVRKHLERSKELLESSSSRTLSANIDLMLAESLWLMADWDTAWAGYYQALGPVLKGGESLRSHNFLENVVNSLHSAELIEEAEPFMEEMILNLAKWEDNLYAPAEVHAIKAQQAYRLDQHSLAEQRIGSARQQLKRLIESEEGKESGAADQLETDLSHLEGLILQDQDPTAAHRHLSDALDSKDETGRVVNREKHLVQRARVAIALGDIESATQDLEEAIKNSEEQRARLLEAMDQNLYFREVQDLFDDLARLQLSDSKTGMATAFATSERARSRFLAERRDFPQPIDEGDPEELVAALQSQLSAGQVLIQTLSVEEELIAWILTPNEQRVVRLPIRQVSLAQQSRHLRSSLKSARDPKESMELGAALYDQVIRPLAIPAESDRWFLVPDGPLAGLPFHALFDRKANRYLGETVAISLLPAARLLLQPSREDQESYEALIVADPNNNLDRAEAEAREVGQAFGSPDILLKDEATRAAVLEGLQTASIFYFAGHSLANTKVPGRSRLELADGFLEAHEIWSQDLSKTKLVVLPSCYSSIGKDQGRQAVFGLASGFLTAGADEVVATYWDVTDASTAPVMVAFAKNYRQLGDASLALRATIQEIAQEPGGGPGQGGWGAFTSIGLRKTQS